MNQRGDCNVIVHEFLTHKRNIFGSTLSLANSFFSCLYPESDSLVYLTICTPFRLDNRCNRCANFVRSSPCRCRLRYKCLSVVLDIPNKTSNTSFLSIASVSIGAALWYRYSHFHRNRQNTSVNGHEMHHCEFADST